MNIKNMYVCMYVYIYIYIHIAYIYKKNAPITLPACACCEQTAVAAERQRAAAGLRHPKGVHGIYGLGFRV